MKTKPAILSTLFILCAMAIAAITGLSGCASLDAPNQERLLTAAGFRPLTPSTAKQQDLYAKLPDYKMQSGMIKGKLVYGYKNPKQGVVYVGGQNEYQQYQRLGLQQSIAQDNLAAAQMNQETMTGFGAWGPSAFWW